jgi:glucosamine-6-phosphate deaminase
MRVVVLEDESRVADAVATHFASLIRRKPDAVLGLATGGTPVGAYQRLIELHRRQGLSFRQISTFNLDEYLGLDEDHPQSYRRFMNEQLFDAIDIDKRRTRVPPGRPDDIRIACQKYEDEIVAAGGIDLQLLGIGRDGHIAFNEPGSSLASRTRCSTLAATTILDNARFFGSEDLVPRAALTMGIGTILEAKQIVLMATGAGKAEAIAGSIEGPISSRVPGSALQLHPDVVVYLDAAAAHRLEYLEYYLESERTHRSLGISPFP